MFANETKEGPSLYVYNMHGGAEALQHPIADRDNKPAPTTHQLVDSLAAAFDLCASAGERPLHIWDGIPRFR